MTDENKTFTLRTDNVTTDNSEPGQLVIRKSFEFGVLTWTEYVPEWKHGVFINYSDDTGRSMPKNEKGLFGALAILSQDGWQVVATASGQYETTIVWLQRESTPVTGGAE